MPSNRLPTALRLAALLALTGFHAGALGAWIGHDEVTVTGRFFDPQVEEELLARRTTHGLQLIRDGEVVWSDGFHAYLSDVFGTCRDLRSARDQLFYVTSSGGSDGAMSINFLASAGGGRFEEVFADLTARPELGRYFRFPEEPMDPEWWEPVDGMICAAEEYRSRRERGLEISRSLAPSEVATPLELDEDERLVPQVLVARELEPALVRTLFRAHGGLGPGAARWTLGENDRWRFEVVAFFHYRASWGVLLLEDRHTGGWRSIYQLPRGDSKNFLIEPSIESLGPETAEIDFCAVCPNWPVGQAAVLDLRTLELKPAVSTGSVGSF